MKEYERFIVFTVLMNVASLFSEQVEFHAAGTVLDAYTVPGYHERLVHKKKVAQNTDRTQQFCLPA